MVGFSLYSAPQHWWLTAEASGQGWREEADLRIRRKVARSDEGENRKNGRAKRRVKGRVGVWAGDRGVLTSCCAVAAAPGRGPWGPASGAGSGTGRGQGWLE